MKPSKAKPSSPSQIEPIRFVRIISGTLRNSKIAVPHRLGLRPTPDRVRETLFNWLAPIISGASVLDLFAGTGALGIEALSRGAAHAEFVETDLALCAKLTGELVRLKVADRARVLADTAMNALAQSRAPVDLIFLDPPFAMEAWDACLAMIVKQQTLKSGALVYVEAPLSWQPPAQWAAHKQARAGAVQFGLYRFQEAVQAL